VASLRQLPSGNFQAAVLLTNGTRTTKTFADETAAIEWAIEVEAERDRLRDEARSRSADEHAAILLDELARLAQHGRLKAEHRDRLLAIVKAISLVEATGDIDVGTRG
jgi:hypothetical protein